MRVIRADEMGMCFGVKDALQVIHQIAKPNQVTIHGELVHNPVVNLQLKEFGFHQSGEENRAIPEENNQVLITAHGISDLERQRLLAADKELIDTTCPLVRRAHNAAVQLQAEGRRVLVIGTPGHVEVCGIVEDLTDFRVVPSAAEVESYAVSKLGVMCQTTTPTENVKSTRAEILRKNPKADIRFIDTVCHPTKKRQTALLDLIEQVDAVVVVGGHNSNNTRRLVQQCEERSRPAYHVACAEELQPEWFCNVATVGLTAGTSTLDETIQSVQNSLEQMQVPESIGT
ncbi:MAG: 4-hydroxy-3-methylbut-2-enyl diphosphate reductase [Planctomycetota bacterium]